ncbi:hypothetical protein CTAYLR_007676 [Chrysophaeum taylorii]|uniref:C-CAP/cofactor C-like domain-containing protein n=1 Tax=Chrysophaeum taylorii TaxID=2483200 RepID=A0AAD7U8I6_9STRA|nr:hypothetical protein CTAYLR_007676 [Chrysophaeum taylorii]
MGDGGFALRHEVFAAVLPHEAAASCAECVQDAQLRVEDVVIVAEELRGPQRRRGAELRDETSYATWLATAWHVLAWPEPSARLFWEMVWLLGDECAGGRDARAPEQVAVGDEPPAERALDARLPASDLALFLLIHCRHDATPPDASAFEEAWIQERRDGDSDTESVESGHAATETPPASPPTSPRSARSTKRASIELCLRARAAAEATRLEWIAARFETILRLVVSDDDDDDSTFGDQGADDARRRRRFQRPFRVSRREFDRLSFLLRVVRAERPSLGAFCPLFDDDADVVDGADLARWLSEALRVDEPPLYSGKVVGGERSPNSHASRSYSCSASTAAGAGTSTMAIVDARRCTRVVVDDATTEEPPLLRDCRIVGCRDVRVYVLTAARYVDVVGCVDCTIVVGAVARVARLVACERTHVVTAAGRAVVSSCLNCCLSLYSPFSPLLDGDNRSCKLAPFCAVYDGLVDHLARARLLATTREQQGLSVVGNAVPPAAAQVDGDERRVAPAPPNLWRVPLRLASAVNRGSNFARSPLSSDSLVLSPADFELVGGPFASRDTLIPFPLPVEYAAALQAKSDRAQDLRRRITDSSLAASDRAKVEAAAKAAFAKWLVESRSLRHVVELMHLENSHDDPDI